MPVELICKNKMVQISFVVSDVESIQKLKCNRTGSLADNHEDADDYESEQLGLLL